MKFARKSGAIHLRVNYPFGVFFLLATAIGASGFATAQKKTPVEPVNLNTATIAQLEQVPGIGPSRARAIVNLREKSGPFERVDDLLAIRGINKARLEKLRPYVIVTPHAAKAVPRASP
ncbi:MAG TPA: helix-hairpin-helix domain-containing protein [Candidatus Acidoferrales bacterium]